MTRRDGRWRRARGGAARPNALPGMVPGALPNALPGILLLAALLATALAGRADAAGARRSTGLRGAPLAETWADTLHVGAHRVTLDEIIADIGRQQRANRDSLRSVAFTAVITTVRTPDGQPPAGSDSLGDWEIDELALRYEQERGRPDRVVRLWERERKFEHGVAQPPTDKPTARPEWQAQPGEVVADLPFSVGSARR